MYGTILVPLDGSEVAASILGQVVAVAHSHGARLLLLTVGQPLPASSTGGSSLPTTFQAEAYLFKVQGFLQAQGLEVSTTVCIGEPAREILDLAERQNVDLIIVNSRGSGATPAPFLGSVAEKVTGAATIPVLVLHSSSQEKWVQ